MCWSTHGANISHRNKYMVTQYVSPRYLDSNGDSGCNRNFSYWDAIRSMSKTSDMKTFLIFRTAKIGSN